MNALQPNSGACVHVHTSIIREWQYKNIYVRLWSLECLVCKITKKIIKITVDHINEKSPE